MASSPFCRKPHGFRGSVRELFTGTTRCARRIEIMNHEMVSWEVASDAGRTLTGRRWGEVLSRTRTPRCHIRRAPAMLWPNSVNIRRLRCWDLYIRSVWRIWTE